tara:strand:- start:1315 stop:1551 length:237 start_codon:yes stop_codon:yes gene_type:complete
MNNEYISKMEELLLQIFVEKKILEKLQHRDSLFTINFINESRNNIIKFDQALARTRNSLIRKIDQLQLEYFELKPERL